MCSGRVCVSFEIIGGCRRSHDESQKKPIGALAYESEGWPLFISPILIYQYEITQGLIKSGYPSLSMCRYAAHAACGGNKPMPL